MKTLDINICGVSVPMDRDAIYTLLATLSETHGKLCNEIGNCGDMEVANNRAGQLQDLTRAYNNVEKVAAAMDQRDARLLQV